MTRWISISAALLGLAGLTGCLGGGPKADLYRFGPAAPTAPAAAVIPSAAIRVITFGGSNFAPAIQGDRLLTVTGTQAAYIARARWISPADALFDATVAAALDQQAPPIRVVGPGALPRTDTLLRIDVRHFEAVYSGSRDAAPTVMLEASVSLISRTDGHLIGERLITVQRSASENRVAAIVAAFDTAALSASRNIASATADLMHGGG